MKRRKIIVLITLAMALFFIGALAVYSHHYLSKSFVFDKEASIFLGNEDAKVKLVLFEDFQCSRCQNFSKQILPQIESHYVDLGIASFEIVPLPLFPGSRALTNAALAIFHDAPDSLFPFLEQSAKKFPKTAVTKKALLEIARKVGGVNLDKIAECIKEKCYYHNINNNLRKTRSIMKKTILVPTLYINGVETSVSSFEMISEQIENLISNQGHHETL